MKSGCSRFFPGASKSAGADLALQSTQGQIALISRGFVFLNRSATEPRRPEVRFSRCLRVSVAKRALQLFPAGIL